MIEKVKLMKNQNPSLNQPNHGLRQCADKAGEQQLGIRWRLYVMSRSEL